jgi:hypothetical protein
MLFSFVFLKTLTNRPPGGGVGPPNFVHLKSYFICDLKSHAKFYNTTITPSGRKVSEAEERNREEREKKCR